MEWNCWGLSYGRGIRNGYVSMQFSEIYIKGSGKKWISVNAIVGDFRTCRLRYPFPRSQAEQVFIMLYIHSHFLV